MSENQQIEFLRGNKVVLRPPLKEDIPLFLRWMNDRTVTYYLASYLPILEADEDEWFEGLTKRKDKDLVFVIVVDGKAIGVMGIHGIDWKDRTATTGAVIGEKDYWRKGYGTEAKMLLLDYAFNTLNLRKICSKVLAFNEASLSYGAKCGYKEEGRLIAQSFVEGEYWDMVLTAVFKEDWLPLWEAFQES